MTGTCWYCTKAKVRPAGPVQLRLVTGLSRTYCGNNAALGCDGTAGFKWYMDIQMKQDLNVFVAYAYCGNSLMKCNHNLIGWQMIDNAQNTSATDCYISSDDIWYVAILWSLQILCLPRWLCQFQSTDSSIKGCRHEFSVLIFCYEFGVNRVLYVYIFL